jgi:mannosyltransferase OCH1-like enzyme
MKRLLLILVLSTNCAQASPLIDDQEYLEQAERFFKQFSKMPEHKQFFTDKLVTTDDLYADFIKNIVIRPEKIPHKFFCDLIEKNNTLSITPRPYYIIPPIIHQIWVGPNSRERFEKIRQTWIAQHPGWLYILWTDNEVKQLNLINQDFYDRTQSYAVKANILRYELLYLFGGLYSDIDSECIKPFDIIHRAYSFYAGVYDTEIINNSIIGAAPRHPILKHVIQKIRDNKEIKQPLIGQNNANNLEYMDVLYTTGPHLFTKAFLEVAEQYASEVMIFPNDYFSPTVTWMLQTKGDSIEGAQIKPETFSIHGFASTWYKK